MAHASAARLLILNAIRIKGLAPVDVLAAAAGESVEATRAQLDELAGSGWTNFREGRLTGWTLTTEGRAQHAKLVAEELDVAGAGDEIDSAYRDFHRANSGLLGVCTDWQLRPRPDGSHEPNDHGDVEYDAAVVVRLRAIDAEVQPVTARLGSALDRFASYGPRLTAARVKVEAGELEWFTKPMIDSYHTVWFELHEDLLATLGIERSKEES